MFPPILLGTLGERVERGLRTRRTHVLTGMAKYTENGWANWAERPLRGTAKSDCD